jgi:release factor glutamine methyltransferase
MDAVATLKAVAAAQRTAAQNEVDVTVHNTSFVEAVYDQVAGQIDILLFNPPYVVTPPEEVGSEGIEASWAGGVNGREVTDLLLPMIPSLLTPGTELV